MRPHQEIAELQRAEPQPEATPPPRERQAEVPRPASTGRPFAEALGDMLTSYLGEAPEGPSVTTTTLDDVHSDEWEKRWAQDAVTNAQGAHRREIRDFRTRMGTSFFQEGRVDTLFDDWHRYESPGRPRRSPVGRGEHGERSPAQRAVAGSRVLEVTRRREVRSGGL